METMWFSHDLFQKFAERRCQDVSNNLDHILLSLNSIPNVKKIPEIRRLFVNRDTTKIFEKWRFSSDGDHVYTYNKGARSELQANIGIWEDGIRLGYGFEPTGAMFGDPEKAYKFLESTRALLQNTNSRVSRIWARLSPLYVEKYTHEFQVDHEFQFFDLYEFLNIKDISWIFFGSFLGIEPSDKSPSILNRKGSFEFIDEFFKATLDFYEEVWEYYRSQEVAKDNESIEGP